MAWFDIDRNYSKIPAVSKTSCSDSNLLYNIQVFKQYICVFIINYYVSLPHSPFFDFQKSSFSLHAKTVPKFKTYVLPHITSHQRNILL